MKSEQLPQANTALTVTGRNLEVVLSEERAHPFSLVLPPLEEMDRIEQLSGAIEASEKKIENDQQVLVGGYLQEYERALAKLPTFEQSATFHLRLADLAEAAKMASVQERHLVKARELEQDPFFAHRYVDALISWNRFDEARGLVAKLDRSLDVYANLRMAMFAIRARRVEEAVELVDHSVSINPTDYRARLFEGGLCLALRKYDQAIRSFRVAAEERPTSSVVYANMAIAYIALDQAPKAIRALQKAVAIGPLNLNALCLFADLAHRQEMDEVALPALRLCVSVEKARTEIWSRLARACIEMKLYDEAIDSLRHEAAIRETSQTWNNIGVAYGMRGDVSRAGQGFKRAMTLAEKAGGYDYFLAARNMAQALHDEGEAQDVLAFANAVIGADSEGITYSNRDVAPIHAIRITALMRAGKAKQAEDVATEIIERRSEDESLLVWSIGFLFSQIGIRSEGADRIWDLFVLHRENIVAFAHKRKGKTTNTLNNIAFALAEIGRTAEAEEVLKLIDPEDLHNAPYPIATAGLIQMRKGRVESAVEKYEDAVRRATGHIHKRRIRQKLNVELGRHFVGEQPEQALKYFRKAAEERNGEAALATLAAREMRLIKGL